LGRQDKGSSGYDIDFNPKIPKNKDKNKLVSKKIKEEKGKINFFHFLLIFAHLTFELFFD
jgi:hypothetical protein